MAFHLHTLAMNKRIVISRGIVFTEIWKKYLPVIVLLMKRADQGEQVLEMNHTDFERAAGGKKVKFTFPEIRLKNGRVDYADKLSTLASDLLALIQENDKARWITAGQLFEFSMNANFQLRIKHVAPETMENP
jgi:hypothetical protein